jgi:hypothetical protein
MTPTRPDLSAITLFGIVLCIVVIAVAEALR